ncbi:hypothetical protein [Rothia nasimurium]|uniref:hypothetical protein n=1 Tax=Rothia nasimurium TaxID=85336 RepID=UPI001F3D1748|nr:hypothetical protein [Rothia nasimurium]
MKRQCLQVIGLAGIMLLSGCSASESGVDAVNLEPPAGAYAWTPITKGFDHSEITLSLVQGRAYVINAQCGGEEGAGFIIDVSYEDGTSIASYQLQCPQHINESLGVTRDERVTMAVSALGGKDLPTHNSYAAILGESE